MKQEAGLEPGKAGHRLGSLSLSGVFRAATWTISSLPLLHLYPCLHRTEALFCLSPPFPLDFSRNHSVVSFWFFFFPLDLFRLAVQGAYGGGGKDPGQQIKDTKPHHFHLL